MRFVGLRYTDRYFYTVETFLRLYHKFQMNKHGNVNRSYICSNQQKTQPFEKGVKIQAKESFDRFVQRSSVYPDRVI